ncbi:MAG TPA: DUF1360 domain-containing protein [Thermoanaerobaculia bacterium]|nr:DUF1360 domain-containing protein [Thermoanaerobaculia bacterium]
MELYGPVLGVLALWRLTHLLVEEDGPWDVMARLRRRAGRRFWGGLIDCFYCLSLWLAAPLAVILADAWPERLLLWPALSGGAALLERATRRQEVPAARYAEEGEEGFDELLRSG